MRWGIKFFIQEVFKNVFYKRWVSFGEILYYSLFHFLFFFFCFLLTFFPCGFDTFYWRVHALSLTLIINIFIGNNYLILIMSTISRFINVQSSSYKIGYRIIYGLRLLPLCI